MLYFACSRVFQTLSALVSLDECPVSESTISTIISSWTFVDAKLTDLLGSGCEMRRTIVLLSLVFFLTLVRFYRLLQLSHRLPPQSPDDDFWVELLSVVIENTCHLISFNVLGLPYLHSVIILKLLSLDCFQLTFLFLCLLSYFAHLINKNRGRK